MVLQLIFTVIVFVAAYFICYWIFRKKISRQVHRMLQVMRADELDLNSSADAYEKSDDFFSDLERAAFGLRRKYLRLKKVSRDERKAYETVFSGLKEGVITVDQNLKIISFNSRFMQLFSWAPPAVGGQSNPNIYLQDIIREPEVIETFKTIFNQNEKTLKKEIGDFELFINFLPSLDENQKWAMGVFYDLSESKKIDRMRVDFVANASHELRTPLTVIKGYSDLLYQRIKSQKSDDVPLIEPIVQSTENMKLLLDDLLSLSKLESGAKVQKVNINVQSLTEDILNEFDSIIAMNKKQIVSRFEAQNVLAEESGLRQVMRNLIINAIRYSGTEAPKIYLTWSQDAQKTYFKVKNHGPEISKEDQIRIFERFYRIDKGRSREQGGTGLGLALVKHQMLSQGGQVYCQSSAEGTEFTCEFNRI